MVAIPLGDFKAFAERVRRMAPVTLTLALLVLLAAFVTSTYFGNGRSPYGMCYGANGRAVPCEWVERR
jgi:hypothetical protein